MTAHIDAPRSECPACREKDGLMPKPNVTIGTVLGYFEPDPADNRENGAKPMVKIEFDRGTRMPIPGDRVAVAGSVDAIFGWMDSLPAKRVVDAAREWAAQVDRFRGVTQREDMGTAARQLYDAVKALGAPSEEPVTTGYDAGDPRGDRGAIVVTITIEEAR